MNKILETAFKKLLGNGRAFRTPVGFMSDFLDLLVSPLVDVKKRLLNIKFTHFPTVNVDENDIINGEELFGIKDTAGKSFEERAANVESQWSSFAGCQTFKQIENILQKKGYSVRVIENIPQNYNTYGGRLIGNGFIQTNNGKADPITIKNGKYSFIVQSDNYFDENEFQKIVEDIAKNKPAHNGAYFIPKYLRKKEIHHVLTKSQMQQIQKYKYCDCRRSNG